MSGIIGVIAVATLVALPANRGARGSYETTTAPTIDVSALLNAAHGAPPMICALAARSIGNYGWGDWSDAPSTPLHTAQLLGDRDGNGRRLPAADVDKLTTALSSDDACVREISIRLLGGQRDTSIARTLTGRLTDQSAPMREVAAYGLGMLQVKSTADALIGTLRDATAGVRANAAWALGRMESGRALAPIVAMFRDNDESVRWAAVTAAGHIDSSSTIEALMRVLQTDESPRVRRVAAWALGQQRRSDASSNVLASTFPKEKDGSVREMIAWAIGNTGVRSAYPALVNALKNDDDENVRETSAWALAEIHDGTSIDALGEAAGNDRSSRVRGTAAWAIGELRGDGGKAPDGVLKALRDDSDETRLKAAWALGQIGDAKALDAIRSALKSETNANVRKALIRAVIKSGGKSEESLTSLLSSADPSVREAAVRGLVGQNAFNPWPWPQPRPRPFP